MDTNRLDSGPRIAQRHRRVAGPVLLIPRLTRAMLTKSGEHEPFSLMTIGRKIRVTVRDPVCRATGALVNQPPRAPIYARPASATPGVGYRRIR